MCQRNGRPVEVRLDELRRGRHGDMGVNVDRYGLRPYFASGLAVTACYGRSVFVPLFRHAYPRLPLGVVRGVRGLLEWTRFCLALRSAKTEIALGAKYIAIEICNPLPPARGEIEIADCALNVRRDALPVELRIEIGEIRRRSVAELLIHADLFELVIECIRLAQVMRVAELPDQIGPAHQQSLLALFVGRRRG